MKNFIFLILILMVTFLNAQNSKKGGYIYGWNDYTSSNDNGLGSRSVFWDSTDVAVIKHAPEIGVHPRIYFGPSEIPDILNRLETTLSGHSVRNNIKAFGILLNVGFGGYNQSADYALDENGFRHIDNSGYWDMSNYYNALKNEDPNVWDGADLNKKFRTAACMSLEAFVCLFYPNNTDPAVGISNQQRAINLARAMTFWAELALDDPNVNPDGGNHLKFGSTHMALCYDLMYNFLTESQREKVRLALAKIIPDAPRHGALTAAFSNTSNWSTLNSFEILNNLAIEGEPGYKPLLTKEWMRSLHNFINYGWYPSGAGYEGLGKNYQFVTTLVAAAKRGYSLLSHPHVRAYGENYLPAIMQPFGKGFTSYDVWGGSGHDAVQGQYKFAASDVVGLKWTFPNSEKIDFVWRNYIGSHHFNNATGYVYAQTPPQFYHNDLIPAAIFALDYTTDSWQNQANAVVKENYIAKDRGLAVLKSSTDSKALSVQFHARQDMGGHTHGDRLDFTLSALGRIWVRKTYGGSQFQPSKYHSMVLINDMGVPLGDPDGDKSRQPATLLNYSFSNEFSQVSADATYAYKWDFHWAPRTADQDHPWLGNNQGWEKVTETWNDFLYEPQSEPHYNIPLYDYPHWSLDNNQLERLVKRLYNPVEKVVRNIGLIKGAHPMLLIVDDVKKDNEVHNYKWTAQLARDLEIDRYDINLTDIDYKCDIIFKEPSSTGNRRLLVRILQNENYDSTTPPGVIELLDYVDYFTGQPFNPNPNYERPRLIVESNSVSPNFKVLMYPYNLGDELPTTNWSERHAELEIIFSDTKTSVIFSKDDLSNTQINVSNTLGVNDHSTLGNNISIYPNPARKMVMISSDTILKNIILYDISGRLILNRDISEQNNVQLDIEHLKDGVYFLKTLTMDNIRVTSKLIIKR